MPGGGAEEEAMMRLLVVKSVLHRDNGRAAARPVTGMLAALARLSGRIEPGAKERPSAKNRHIR
jgi:hypothetical protein